MKRYAIGVLTGFCVLLTSGNLPAQERAERLFYYVDSEESFNDLNAHADWISIVAPAWYSVDDDGIVWGSVDNRVLSVAKVHNIRVMPLVVNPGFDQSLLHRLLNNEKARGRAIASLVELCQQHDFVGFQFDFEDLHINDREAFSRFFRETAEAFHQHHFTLSVAVVHRPEQFAGTTPYHKWLFKNWRAGYDLAELAREGDFVSVMTYSQHTRRTTPGPNAGIPWAQQVLEYFLTYVPPEKLSFGIPLQSQHWYTTLDTAGFALSAHSWSRPLSHAEAVGLLGRSNAAPIWNETQGVPYAVFENAGLFEYVYLEDARSFAVKYKLIQKYRLRGFSAWVLGAEDTALWNELPRVGR